MGPQMVSVKISPVAGKCLTWLTYNADIAVAEEARISFQFGRDWRLAPRGENTTHLTALSLFDEAEYRVFGEGWLDFESERDLRPVDARFGQRYAANESVRHVRLVQGDPILQHDFCLA